MEIAAREQTQALRANSQQRKTRKTKLAVRQYKGLVWCEQNHSNALTLTATNNMNFMILTCLQM